MTRSFTPGAPASSSRRNEAASSTCSKLSSSSSVCLSRRYSSSASRAECPGRSLTPSSLAIALATSTAIGDAAELDEHGACGLCPRKGRSPRAPGASSPTRLHRSASGAAPPRDPAARGSPAARASAPRRTTSDSPGSAPRCAAPSAGGSAVTRSSAGSWSRIERSSCRSASVGSMPSVSTSERLASRYAASASACLPER